MSGTYQELINFTFIFTEQTRPLPLVFGMGQGKGFGKDKKEGCCRTVWLIWRQDRQRLEQDEHSVCVGGVFFLLSPCSSSVTPAPFPIRLLSRAAWAALLTDKWPPYGLLPYYLLLFSQLRDPGEQAASSGCTPIPPPSVTTAKRRVAGRTTSLHPIPSRPGHHPVQ